MPNRIPTHKPQRAAIPSAAEAARGTAAERGYGASWRRLRLWFLRRNPLCVQCGQAATDVDHVIPRAKGGGDEEANLQALCHLCHSRKTASEDGGFGRTRPATDEHG